ncbi:unnamed protein product [Alopecurus aequalis]
MAKVFQDLENLLPVQILVLISLGLQVILFLCAGARRKETFSGVPVRALLLWLAYHFGSTFATYTLARISFFSAAGSHPLVELWAPFLLLHLAGPDNIASYALQDSQHSLHSLQTFLSQVTAGGYFFYTYRNSGGDFLRLSASGLMFVVAVVKYGEWWLALKRGNLGSIRGSLKQTKPPPAKNFNHVNPHDVKLEVEDDLETLEESSVRRAHTLFHSFKNGIVYSSVEKTGSRENVIKKMKHLEHWTLVEMELSLMYDILYTKAAVVHTWHGYTIRVISPLAISTSLLLFHFSEDDGHRNVDTVMTYVLFGSALFMEWISLLNALGSSWMFNTLCTTRRTWIRDKFLRSGRWDQLRRFVISLNSLVGFGGSRTGARRWPGNMGQYNMLHFCTRPDGLFTRPLLGRLAELVGLRELWNRKHFSGAINILDHVPIKMCINEQINLLLRDAGLDTMGMIKRQWGMTTLVHCKLADNFQGTLGNEFQEGIINWHIGTDFFLSKCKSSADHEDLVNAVKVLSHYMMFLLVERPYMLPPGIDQNVLYERTCKALDGVSHQPTSICAMLKSLFSWRDDPAAAYTSSRATDSKTYAGNLFNKNDPIQEYRYESVRFTYSATVAHELLQYEEEHGTSESLQLLLEVWTDMLVYAGNRCSRDSHAKKLSSGGELTTIVWLLVEHFHQALVEVDNPKCE